MNDEPRVLYGDAEEFLGIALDLLAQDRVLWDHSHQSGHKVSKAEAEQIVYWSAPKDWQRHDEVEGRWVMWGKNRTNQVIFISASVTLRPDGLYLFLRAWPEYVRFGS